MSLSGNATGAGKEQKSQKLLNFLEEKMKQIL